MAHVGQRPTPELIPTAEHGMGIVRVVWAVHGWAEPQLPVKASRHWRSVGGYGRVLRPHGSVGPIVDLAQCPDDAVVDPAFDGPDVLAVIGRQEMGRHFGFAGGLD